MTEPLSRIPNGLRYYSARDARVRRTIEETAMSVFDGWSYEEIVTPTLDYYSLFELGMGKMEAHRAFRFTDDDGRLLALRPDVTSGIARAAATLFAKRERPLRLCYAAAVFHQQSQSHADWRRESTQIGCELLGGNTTAADMEVLAVATEVLRRLGLDPGFVITLNDVEIFNGIVENLALDSSARDELHRLMDIRAVADLECFLTSYASADECSAFANLVQLSGKREIFDEARVVITNARSRTALDRLESLWSVIDSLGMSQHFEIDLGDVSRLDYYTGLTFKIYVDGVGRRVGGGGRYDHLTGKFGKGEPAVGFVLELDALADLLACSAELMRMPTPEKAVLNPVNGDVAALFGEAIALRASDECVMIEGNEVTSCRN
jgi:ATP phosphoribosyltransferase regulatory subunit